MQEARVTIVGRNHCQDVSLALNERIYLQRQPHNEHDSNAIAAYKNSGRIFGHMISSTARRLSTILRTEDKLRGYISCGNNSQHMCSVSIGIYLSFFINDIYRKQDNMMLFYMLIPMEIIKKSYLTPCKNGNFFGARQRLKWIFHYR